MDTPEDRCGKLRVLMLLHDIDGAVTTRMETYDRRWGGDYGARLIYYPYAGSAAKRIYYYTLEGAESGVHRLIRRKMAGEQI